MKKLIIALTVSTLALASSLYASDTKAAADKGGCCGDSKTTAYAGNKNAKMACCSAGKSACSKTLSKRIALSPKAAELLGAR